MTTSGRIRTRECTVGSRRPKPRGREPQQATASLRKFLKILKKKKGIPSKGGAPGRLGGQGVRLSISRL